MTHSVIEIKDLWFSFNGSPVLKNVNLSIYEHEFLALIGPNGGGKTTLLKLILGLLTPDQGTISVFGKSPHQISQRMGYVPQEMGMNRRFPVSAMDVVLMGRLTPRIKSRHHYSEHDKAVVQESMKRLGIWEFRQRRIGELSGGQRQRVFIARALVTEPEILLLDEPTANVDVKGQSDVYAMLRELNDKMTIIVVSHDAMVLSSYIKSVACVNRQVHFHNDAEITPEMLEMAYSCPVEIIAHGMPHRVLKTHEEARPAGSSDDRSSPT